MLVLYNTTTHSECLSCEPNVIWVFSALDVVELSLSFGIQKCHLGKYVGELSKKLQLAAESMKPSAWAIYHIVTFPTREL